MGSGMDQGESSVDAGSEDLGGDDDAGASVDMEEEDDLSGDEDMGSSGEVTYHQHIKPILNRSCMRCHGEGGQGPLDFSNAATVQTLGELILSEVDVGTMPPAVAKPGCRDYLSSEQLSLPEADKETLRAWVDGGKLMGVDDGVMAKPPETATFDDPDLMLKLPSAYTPTYEDESNPNNEYRCFALEHNQEETFYITGMHPLIDQSAIVHHVVLAKLPRNQAPAETFSPEGQNCIDDMRALSGGGSPTGGMVGAWAPGMDPISFENGGLEVKPNEVLILQMHYYADREEHMNLADQSGYALKIADSVKNPILMYPLSPGRFTIPAGADSHKETEELDLPVPITLWGVFPHMHVLGDAYDMKVTISDEEQCLLDGPKYDFNNQLTYIYKEPLYVPANSPIEFSCTWNNSPSNPGLIHNPPIDVGYGERTDQEMCFMFSYVSIGPIRN